MRIAMFMPELDPGALGSLIYRDFRDALRERGHSFDCLVTSPVSTSVGEDDGWMKQLPQSRGWQRADSLMSPWLRTRALATHAATLATYLRTKGRDLDVLHIEIAYPTGAAAALAAMASRWPGLIAVTPMGEDVLVVRDASYGFRRHLAPRALVSWTLRRAGAIRCISPLIQALVDQEWPGCFRRTVPLNVARKAVSFLEEPPSVRAERRRQARKLLEAQYPVAGKGLILALGRLHPFKGLDILIEALPAVADAHLLVAGPSLTVRPFGDVASYLSGIARVRGVSERVHWLGKVPPPQALDLLGGADVVAVPSHLESLNRVCVEAAAGGTPFVATETTGVTGWIPGPGVGLVVPPRDPPALATALNEILHGNWCRDDEQAAAFVRQFSPDRVAAQVVELYTEALTQRHVRNVS